VARSGWPYHELSGPVVLRTGFGNEFGKGRPGQRLFCGYVISTYKSDEAQGYVAFFAYLNFCFSTVLSTSHL
jgi:hypothetical protein